MAITTDLGATMASIRTVRFDRHELAGAFGDIGTDLPLIVAMIVAAGLHSPSVLIVFGSLQVLSGFIYRMPMPVQPLKAMATLVIADSIAGPVLMGAGLAIGVVMLLLSVTGTLDLLARSIPKAVIRGLQFGLGLMLCILAFTNYIGSDGIPGYLMASLAFVMVILLMDRKHWPVSLLLIALGALYALLRPGEVPMSVSMIGFELPRFFVPSLDDIATGFVLLALPQIPLSLGNSIIATKQVSDDLFPDRTPLTARRIGMTYGLMNMINPFLGGIPTCHGSGGMVGHYTFGGRTGGSVVIYGTMYIMAGLFFSNGFDTLVRLFPLPILGVILFFEGFALTLFLKDTLGRSRDLLVAILTGILAVGLPYGFLVALVAGTAIYYGKPRLRTLEQLGGEGKDPGTKA